MTGRHDDFTATEAEAGAHARATANHESGMTLADVWEPPCDYCGQAMGCASDCRYVVQVDVDALVALQEVVRRWAA